MKEQHAFLLVPDTVDPVWWCLCPAYPGLSVFADTPEAALADAQKLLPDFVAEDPQRGHCLTAPSLMARLFKRMNYYLRLSMPSDREVSPEDIEWAQQELKEGE